MKNSCKWSVSDLEIIKNFYPSEGYIGVMTRMEDKKSKQAIIAKAFKLKLVSKAPRKTHGMVGTRTYKAWYSCIQRCTNKKHPESERYLSAGIKVCDRWIKSFTDFLNDMGIAPTDLHVLDRKNPLKGYEPGNCRWATPKQSAANTRKKSHSTNQFKGVSKLPSGKWRALVNRNSGSRHIGVFNSEREAAIAYDIEATKEFGEFAMTNKMLGLL